MMSRAMMMPRPEPPFIVDREFLYAIYDMQNKRILFSGNLVKPESFEFKRSHQSSLAGGPFVETEESSYVESTRRA